MAEYKIGQLVYHIRFDYRGVIFKVDNTFQLTEEWYDHMCKNTKPPKDKPWYSVFVHNQTHTTYVTERNLIPDDSKKEILHPMVPFYFTSLKNGVYSRTTNWIDETPMPPPTTIGVA
jgi:heat shock protein HspQ